MNLLNSPNSVNHNKIQKQSSYQTYYLSGSRSIPTESKVFHYYVLAIHLDTYPDVNYLGMYPIVRHGVSLATILLLDFVEISQSSAEV